MTTNIGRPPSRAAPCTRAAWPRPRVGETELVKDEADVHARLKRGIEKRSDGPHVRVMRMHVSCAATYITSHWQSTNTRMHTGGCTQADAPQINTRTQTQTHPGTLRKHHKAPTQRHPPISQNLTSSLQHPPSPHPSNSPMAHPCPTHINMALFSCCA